MRMSIPILLSLAVMSGAPQGPVPWPSPKSPVIADADGYVDIREAAVPPDKAHVYRAIFDATRAADNPTGLIPALNMVGSELNAMRVAGVPERNVKFAVVFHGPAIDALLDDTHYEAKFGVDNPNLHVLAQLKAAKVDLLVCGQNLAFDHVDPKSLSPDVTVASDALIVLMTYHDRGYATLRF